MPYSQLQPVLAPLFQTLQTPTTEISVSPSVTATASPDGSTASGDRLLRLLVKGLLYEACVDYCALMATSGTESFTAPDSSNQRAPMHLPRLLGGRRSYVSLIISWP
ncbi:unnamed protein product [Protopolystoma xenopodis]|uniref:WDR47 cross-over region domain-containing protein n=1 Tax=Protopolystoma xenopodis TaxID=117903 RepID=A0A3S5CPP1_9PLAT|nr:unnamed protein product [Protopolystoma xenopodis]